MKRLPLIWMIVAIVMAIAMVIPASATPIWTLYGGHEYAIIDPAPTWQIAESTSVGFGGHLVAINDAAENDFVNQLVLADYPAERAWIGLFQQPGSTEPDQGWGWSSGDPYVFTNWAAGQPSGGTGANFGLILPDGTWNDVSSDVNFQPHIGVAERNIPEASTSALLGLGLLALILRRRREKH